jgi:outer membrane immunogenic protein
MTFRSALLASAAILTAGSAFAADLPARVAPAPYIAAPIFTWTGFYVGLNAGAGFNGSNNNGFVTNGFGGTTFVTTGGGSNNDAGFTGGAQAGYNMQFGSFVVGVEGDINYLDRGNNGSVSAVGTDGYTYTFNRGDSNNWFGTVRARLGFAFDRALIYGTGGFAFGGKNGGVNGSYVLTNSNGTPVALVGNNSDGSSTGWALGGGVEYAFTNAWSAKLEYLHVSLGNHNNNLAFVSNGTTNFNFHDNNKFDVVRVGVNYRF